MEKAEAAVKMIEGVQEEDIKKHGFEEAKKILLYFDDVVGDPIFMKSKAMINAFIKNRHYGFSDILCSQYFKAIPRRMRQQLACCIFFDCSDTEFETIAEDFLPPGVNKKVFIKTLQSHVSEKYSFITYNKQSPWPERWRSGLAHVINFNPDNEEPEKEQPKKKLKIIEK